MCAITKYTKTIIGKVCFLLVICTTIVVKVHAQGYSFEEGDTEPIRGLSLKELQAIMNKNKKANSGNVAEEKNDASDNILLLPTLFEPNPNSGETFVRCATSGVLTCQNANLDFEQANFNGWRGRTGTYKLPNSCFALDCASSNCKPQDEWNSNSSVLSTAPNINFQILSKTGNSSITDYFGGFPIFNSKTGDHVAKIGNFLGNWDAHELAYTYTTTRDNPFLMYKYAPVLELPVTCNNSGQAHNYCENPKFQVRVYDETCNLVACGSLDVSPTSPGMSYYLNNNSKCYRSVGYKNWTTNVVDLRNFFTGTEERKFTIVFSVSDCAQGGHFAYAYIDANCANTIVDVSGNPCINNELTFSSPGLNHTSELITWNFGDGSQNQTGHIVTHKFATAGTYNVKCTLTYNNGYVPNNNPCQIIFEKETIISTCDGYALKCEECIKTFQPEPGKKYIVSAWVKEARDDLPVVTSGSSGIYTYADPQVFISYAGGTTQTETFSASGPIIDGWQRIHSIFTVPSSNVTYIHLDLKNNGTHDVFFDDVRVFPVDGTMKSYVYDPLTQRLMAELDENNYATLYEYNKEGTLVRVKKETERGIKTIKENQGSTKVK